jgi:hypothetical protein
LPDILEDSFSQRRITTSIVDVWATYWTSTIQRLINNRKPREEVQYIAKVALKQLDFVLAKLLPEIQKENSVKSLNNNGLEQPSDMTADSLLEEKKITALRDCREP